ncbi:MAG: TonB-dependent receptor [Sphingomonas sp.]|uniref:TonB-dependent receptor n=1 Tax=Sphingomonas sp. TaxID=28214 RepID=UPI001AD53986|nr:TonB-dependent receptor [Sphingomonas sp.]MBN8815218.1 TonB-dependent receptor [Sphingomonas sp.]
MKVRAVLLLSSGLAAMAAAPQMAVAQEAATASPSASESQGDIVVTARRRDEKLSDIPTAVSVIDATSLNDRGGATDVRELLADQPSVRFNNLNSTITSEISIRASSTARATNGDPSVGLYRDGAYIGGGGIGGRNYTRLDLLDIGRVEVLRGTQGALYGRNAVGGAINIISARPEFENSGFVNLRYDFETEGKQAQGAVNLKLTDDIAIRVSGDGISQDKGFFYNPDNDVYFDRQKGYGVRGQIRFKTGPLDLVLLAETQDLTTPDVFYQIAIARGTPGFPGGFVQDKFRYTWNTRPRATQDVDTYQALATLDLGGATLSSTTSYRVRNSQYDLDNDGIDAADLAAARARGDIVVNIDTGAASHVIDTTKSFNQDLHLTGKALGDRLTWLVGGDVLILKSDYQVSTTRTVTPTNPSIGTRAPASLDYKSYAAYGSLGYDLTDTLNVTGEVRYTKDDRALSARLFDLGTGVPLGGAARVVDVRIKPDNVSYNATLSYKLGGGVLTYAKIGSSYRAGGFNTNLGDPRQPTPIQAAYGNENSTSYEIGIRGAPAKGLYFAAAGYYTDLSNLIAQTDNGCAVTNPACPVAATSFLTNAGDARSYGVEAELSNVLPVANGQFRFALSASWQGGKVTSGKFKDFRLPQVPDWLASVNVNFRHGFIAGTTIVANLLYSVQFGGVQELKVNSVKLDDFDLLNLRLGIEKGPVTVSLFADNVFDQIYRVARDTTINRYSTPRVIGIEARFHW